MEFTTLNRVKWRRRFGLWRPFRCLCLLGTSLNLWQVSQSARIFRPDRTTLVPIHFILLSTFFGQWLLFSKWNKCLEIVEKIQLKLGPPGGTCCFLAAEMLDRKTILWSAEPLKSSTIPDSSKFRVRPKSSKVQSRRPARHDRPPLQ